MLKNKRILLTILMVVLLLLIPNLVKAEGETEFVTKINITGPNPIAEKELYTIEDYNIEAEGLPDIEIRIAFISWEKYNEGTGEFEETSDTKFEKYKKYKAIFSTAVPDAYAHGDPTCNFNGKNAPIAGYGGGEGFHGYAFEYEFDYTKPEKAVETVNITGPEPVAGKDLYDKEDYNAIAQDFPDVKINIINVFWHEYNEETGEFKKTSDTKFEKDKKYRVFIDLEVPEEYSYEDPNFKINDNEAVLGGLGGTAEVRDYEVYYDFEPATEEIEKTAKTDTTKAPGTIPYAGGTFALIIGTIAVIGLGIYGFRKNNDLKGI